MEIVNLVERKIGGPIVNIYGDLSIIFQSSRQQTLTSTHAHVGEKHDDMILKF